MTAQVAAQAAAVWAALRAAAQQAVAVAQAAGGAAGSRWLKGIERESDGARKRREGRRRDKGLTLNLLACLIKRSPLYREVYNC
jgi:hypothetical protein